MERTNPFKPIYDALNAGLRKTDEIGAFPVCLDVELTNHCNLQCLMCPTGTGAFSRGRGYMSDEVYYRILDEAGGKKAGLRFIRWGEPLMHPRVVRYVSDAKARGMLCHINTNGVLCDMSMSAALMEAGLDSVKFSFQGTDAHSYEEMRQGGHFDKLLSHIKGMYDARGGGSLPYIHIATTTTTESGEQIEAFKARVSGICDLVTVGKTRMEHIDADKTRLSVEGKAALEALKARASMVEKRLLVCPEVFGKLSVDWDGQVTACCGDYDRKMIVGDVRDSTLEAIFHGERINRYRAILRNNEFDRIPLCSRCFDLMNLQPQAAEV